MFESDTVSISDGDCQTSPSYPRDIDRGDSERTEILRLQKQGLPWDACDTRYHRKRKDKSECVLAVHVEPEQAFLADETKAGVQPEGSGVVYFSFEDYL